MALLDCVCGRKIVAKPEWAGKRLRCSACGAVLAVPEDDTGGTGALIVAIIAWVICGLLHPVAWYMGASYVADCEGAGVEPSGAGKAAKTLGLVGTIIIGAVVVLGVLFAVLGALLH